MNGNDNKLLPNSTCPATRWTPAAIQAISNHLSPEGVATIIAFLRPASFYKPPTKEVAQALQQVEFFADKLTELLGVEEHNRLMDKLGL